MFVEQLAVVAVGLQARELALCLADRLGSAPAKVDIGDCNQLLAHRRLHARTAPAAGTDHRHFHLLSLVFSSQDRRCGKRSSGEQG